MYKCQVLTWWTPERRPHVFSLLAQGDSGMDATGQPVENITPAPNMLIVELWCSAATLSAIIAHPDHGQGAILWSEEIIIDEL